MLYEWAKALCVDAKEQLSKSQPPMSIEDGAATEVCGSVERRLRTILTEAQHRRLGRRGEQLSVDDVNGALDALGLEQSVGSRSSRGLSSREVDLKQRSNAALPCPPADPSLVLHWLAVKGSAANVAESTTEAQASGGSTQAVPSREHELYARKVVETLRDDSADDGERREVFRSLRTADGIAGIAPILVAFCADQAAKAKKRSIRSLRNAVAALRALALNRRARVEPVLHDVLPAMLTCVVAKKLGNDSTDEHLVLRAQAARSVADVCEDYGDDYVSLRPRVAKTLVDALADTSKPLATRYGAIVAIDALGPLAVGSLLVPAANDLVADLSNRSREKHANDCTFALILAIKNYAQHADLLAVNNFAPLPPTHTSKRLKKTLGLTVGAKPNSKPPAKSRIGSSSPSLALLDTFGEALVPFAAPIPPQLFI